MRIFLSYHRADSRALRKIRYKLLELGYQVYSVPEDTDFSGMHNEHISTMILQHMEDCDIVLVLVGENTYSRPHVDREIHAALSGGVRVRKGVIAVFLESRSDSISSINQSTYPTRLLRNNNYVVSVTNSALMEKLPMLLNQAIQNRNNASLSVNNGDHCMNLPNRRYYDDMY